MPSKQIAAVGQTALGDASAANVSTKAIQIAMNGATGVSITVKGRRPGSSMTAYPIPYRRRYVNGVVGDEAFGSGAITGDSLVEVNAAGIEVILETTAITGGPVLVDYGDLIG